MKWSAIAGSLLADSMRVQRMFVTMLLVVSASCRSAEPQTLDAGPTTTTPEAKPAQVVAVSSSAPVASDAGFGMSTDASFDASTDADANSMMDADIDAGTDAEADAGPPPACPAEMAHIGRYCVDRWEGHLLTKNPDGTTALWPHYQRPENALFLAHSAQGVYPQGYISRVEAAKACEQAGKRLCSRAEWMRACKGSRGFRYPYGNDGKRGACNTGKAHLLTTFFGPKGWSYENFNDPKLDQEPGFLARSGDYTKCHSDEDVSDIVGNLHEWIKDDVGTDIEQVLEKDGVERKEQPWRAGNGMFMGGFFSTTVEHGPGCTYTTIAHEPTYHDYSTGFRCCKGATRPDKPSKNKGKSKK